jgi:citrate lyase beta subunit
MVRVNPLNPDSAAEVDDVLAAGADWLMLPMFSPATKVRAFSTLVAGRAPIVALLETAQCARHAGRLGRHAGSARGVCGLERPAPLAGLRLHV